MKILINSIYFAPEQIGIALYTTDIAHFMRSLGHTVTVVTSKPYYPEWKTYPGYRTKPYIGQTDTQGVRIVYCPLYVPARPTGARRILHYLSYGIGCVPPMIAAALREKPDVVLLVAPTLLGVPATCLAARLSGSKSWLHVQDLEVDAALGTGLIARTGWIARCAFAFERWTLARFDRVSSLCASMLDTLAGKGVARDRLYELRNWADLSTVVPLERPSVFRARFGITTRHVALYSGNIASKQGIDILVETARLLRDRDDLTFVICGDGPALAGLRRAAQGLDNVRFFGLQPRGDLGELMGLADVHLLPQLADAADLLLPSKLTNMLASGRPVLATAAPGTGLAAEVAGCGVCVPPEDAGQLAHALARLLDDPDRRAELGRAARARALSHWDRDAVLDKFMAELHRLTQIEAASHGPARAGPTTLENPRKDSE